MVAAEVVSAGPRDAPRLRALLLRTLFVLAAAVSAWLLGSLLSHATAAATPLPLPVTAQGSGSEHPAQAQGPQHDRAGEPGAGLLSGLTTTVLHTRYEKISDVLDTGEHVVADAHRAVATVVEHAHAVATPSIVSVQPVVDAAGPLIQKATSELAPRQDTPQPVAVPTTTHAAAEAPSAPTPACAPDPPADHPVADTSADHTTTSGAATHPRAEGDARPSAPVEDNLPPSPALVGGTHGPLLPDPQPQPGPQPSPAPTSSYTGGHGDHDSSRCAPALLQFTGGYDAPRVTNTADYDTRAPRWAPGLPDASPG